MTLLEANNLIQKEKKKVVDTYRLVFHAMPEFGWMNDPNGFVYYQGKYHVFYQHHPYNSVWGPMHWGHMTTDDLVKFTPQPIALAPDQSDETGCFSGGAIVDRKDPKKLHLFYTKHFDHNGELIETQGMASSTDGIHFFKVPKPIIDQSIIKPYGSVQDNRDPYPVLIHGVYYILVGTKDQDQVGKFLIYKSLDLKKFEFHDSISHDSLKNCMAECPGLLTLDGQDILIYSAVDHNKSANKNYSKYMIGTFNIENKQYHIDKIESFDSGHHFYAPQATKDHLGRTLVIAWMEMWGHKNVTHEYNHHWSGALTFPRELKFQNGKLLQFPIEEIKHYRGVSNSLRNEQLIPKSVDIEMDSINMPFYLHFANPSNKVESFKITYDGFKVSVDGMSIELDPLENKHSVRSYNEISLRILVDTSSIEIFVNSGEETFTSRVFMDCQEYQIFCSPYLNGHVHSIHMEEKS
ncbi:MAG: GH32 C-terminal domain-containing protein [Firmicutes bacterium]|nr:GH32 C-terminal domain-containing protein [Bacillota bacterium]